MRKVIQIAITDCTDEGSDVFRRTLALCDDGTMWELLFRDAEQAEWRRVPNVPQPDQGV